MYKQVMMEQIGYQEQQIRDVKTAENADCARRRAAMIAGLKILKTRKH